MKKVVAIHSSRRRKNTYGLLLSAQKALAAQGVECTVINLCDFSILECSGCECCLKNDRCPLPDDMASLMAELSAADGIILSSPVYMAGVSGKLKTFIDRTCKWYHRPQLVGKPVLLAVTTAGGYAGEVLAYMEKVSLFWGMQPVGKIFRTAKNRDEAVTAREIAPFLRLLSESKAVCRPSFKALVSFQVQKVLALKILKIDKAYWEERNWNRQLYYLPCKTSPLKRVAAAAFYKLLDTVIKPADEP